MQSVFFGADDATVTVKNVGGDAQDMNGWFICQQPSYWPFPAITLASGQELEISTGAGEDDEQRVHASGGFGQLSPTQGEVGLYEFADFANSDAIRAYVGWNGGGGRLGVAQGAGIWDDGALEIPDAAPVAIGYIGEGTGASAYVVSATTTSSNNGAAPGDAAGNQPAGQSPDDDDSSGGFYD